MEDTSTLTILETLSKTTDIHQRKIAAKTGLNLAKVNFVLKRLVDKGYVKLKRAKDNPNRRRYLYLLTPTGMAEKSRLTYHFIQRTLQSYEAVERKVADHVESMLAQGVKKVVLWGNTPITDLCLKLFSRMNGTIEILGVVDTTGSHSKSIHPSRLEALEPDAIFLCDSDSSEIPKEYPVWRLQ